MTTALLAPEIDTMPLDEIVSTNVRLLADLRGYTRSAIAREMGIDNNSTGRRFRGEMEWRLSELPRLARILGVTVDDLMTPPPSYLRPRQDSNLQPSD